MIRSWRRTRCSSGPRRPGWSAPRQLLTVAGEPAVYVDGETLRVFDWLELAPPDRDLDADWRSGRLLAALHTAGGPTTGAVDPWFVEPVGRDHWVELVAELRLAGAPFAADARRSRRRAGRQRGRSWSRRGT